MSNTKTIEIYLWLLERTESAHTGEWAKCIVAGTTEQQARQIANEDSNAEGYVWTDGSLTQAKKIGTADDGVQGIVLWATE